VKREAEKAIETVRLHPQSHDCVSSTMSSSSSDQTVSSSSISSSKSSYSSSSCESSSSVTKAERVVPWSITKTLSIKGTVPSFIKPFSIILNMKGTEPVPEIIQNITNAFNLDPNLICSVTGNSAHFTFYDSDYYFTLQPGSTYVRGNEETMKLIVTDLHDIRIIDPQI